MTTIALTLPDDLADRLRSQVAAEPGSSLESYILALIAADQHLWDDEGLEAKLLAGLEGPSAPLDAEEWARIRQEARARATSSIERP